MPLYEYHCPDCQQDFEQRVPMAEADQTPCPHCGGQHTQRRLPRIALHLQTPNHVFEAAPDGTCATGSCCGGSCGLDDLN
jgi:putative FmdB family regulatory protein